MTIRLNTPKPDGGGGATFTIRGLNPELHKAFRFHCLDRGVSVNQALKQFMAECVEEKRGSQE